MLTGTVAADEPFLLEMGGRRWRFLGLSPEGHYVQACGPVVQGWNAQSGELIWTRVLPGERADWVQWGPGSSPCLVAVDPIARETREPAMITMAEVFVGMQAWSRQSRCRFYRWPDWELELECVTMFPSLGTFSPDLKWQAWCAGNPEWITLARADLSEQWPLLRSAPRTCMGNVVSVAFSPCSQWLAAVDAEELRVWQVSSRKLVGQARGSFTSLCFHPSRPWLLTTSAEGVQLWERPQPGWWATTMRRKQTASCPFPLKRCVFVDETWFVGLATEVGAAAWHLGANGVFGERKNLETPAASDMMPVIGRFAQGGGWVAVDASPWLNRHAPVRLFSAHVDEPVLVGQSGAEPQDCTLSADGVDYRCENEHWRFDWNTGRVEPGPALPLPDYHPDHSRDGRWRVVGKHLLDGQGSVVAEVPASSSVKWDQQSRAVIARGSDAGSYAAFRHDDGFVVHHLDGEGWSLSACARFAVQNSEGRFCLWSSEEERIVAEGEGTGLLDQSAQWLWQQHPDCSITLKRSGSPAEESHFGFGRKLPADFTHLQSGPEAAWFVFYSIQGPVLALDRVEKRMLELPFAAAVGAVFLSGELVALRLAPFEEATVALWCLRRSKVLARIYLYAGGAWLVRTPDGAWNGSQGMEQRMKMLHGNSVITLAEAPGRREPGLWAKVLEP